MPTVALTTYQDLIDHGVSYLGDNATRDALRDVKRAALDAYRDVPNAHDWLYYYQRDHIATAEPYSTGTIGYDHSGGTYERQVTLTGGTWPEWARLGQLVISNIVYQVAERKSSSVLTLTYRSNPGADVDAGTSYTLYRDSYPLPADFAAAERLVNATNSLALSYEHPRSWMARQAVYQGPGMPVVYTLTADENYFGAMAARLWPPPDAAYALNYLYKRRPRPLKVADEKEGTVSVTSGSASVSGSGTAFGQQHVGCVLRLSGDAADLPTGPAGANPYAAERVVVSVESATALTADEALGDTLSGVKYVLSDPVDVEEGAMLTVLLRGLEKHLTVARIMKNAPLALTAYREALIQAKEADRRSLAPRAYGAGPGWPRLGDFPRGDDVS